MNRVFRIKSISYRLVFSCMLLVLLLGVDAPEAPTNAWREIGHGLTGRVFDLEVVGASLYAGGDFLEAGGNPNANHTALPNQQSASSLVRHGLGFSECTVDWNVVVRLPGILDAPRFRRLLALRLPSGRAYCFPRRASLMVALSNDKSAANRLRRVFSCSNSHSWCAWSTFSPLYDLRHR